MEINIDYLRENLKNDLLNMGFDEDSLDIGLDAFYESINDSLPCLIDALNKEDFEQIRFYSHALKGTFANFENEQFKSLSELFKKIEFEAKGSQSIEMIKNYFENVKDLSSDWLKID